MNQHDYEQSNNIDRPFNAQKQNKGLNQTKIKTKALRACSREAQT